MANGSELLYCRSVKDSAPMAASHVYLLAIQLLPCMVIINHGYEIGAGFQTPAVNVLVFIMPICPVKAVNTSLQMEKKIKEKQLLPTNWHLPNVISSNKELHPLGIFLVLLFLRQNFSALFPFLLISP